MKIKKPNWTPIELDAKYRRWEILVEQTANHETECQCNLCMERFGLGELNSLFSEDEHVSAVIAYNKSLEVK